MKQQNDYLLGAENGREKTGLAHSTAMLKTDSHCGVESLDAKAQFELASHVYRWEPFPPFKYEPEKVDRRSRLSKLQRLAEDPGATNSERQAALAVIERVRQAEATP
jgi:hypothetical protein